MLQNGNLTPAAKPRQGPSLDYSKQRTEEEFVLFIGLGTSIGTGEPMEISYRGVTRSYTSQEDDSSNSVTKEIRHTVGSPVLGLPSLIVLTRDEDVLNQYDVSRNREKENILGLVFISLEILS